VRIRVQMGKCSFYRMEGNKVHNAEHFLKYRASKQSGIIRFCTLPVYWTALLQTLRSKCGLRFSRPWQRISGGRDVTTYSRAISSHIQNNIMSFAFLHLSLLLMYYPIPPLYVQLTQWHCHLNYVTMNNCAYVWMISGIYERRVSWRDLWCNRGTYPETDKEIMTINHAIPWPDEDSNSTPREYESETLPIRPALLVSLALYYRYAPHNDGSVNDGPHIRRWSHNITIL